MIKDAEGIFFEKGAELEVANVISGMSQLGYRNLQAVDILHKCLLGEEFS